MTMKNSQNSPLQIAEVHLEKNEGRIGLTLCPGKKDSSRNWDRDLKEDLRVIRQWGATTVVTLIEDHEFKMLGIENFGQEISAHGLDWIHLPIRDVDVPDQLFEDAWALSGKILHERLDAGDRVLIHCRGGLGRTGLVAGRILIERGCNPALAIQRVRAVRPHAIETPPQEQYVLRMTSTSIDSNDWQARVTASLLAGALGDAAGYLVEFSSLEAIREKYGSKGLILAGLCDSPLNVSDDTQMTMFTLEGIIAAMASTMRRHADGVSFDAIEHCIRKAYLDWYGTQIPTDRTPVGKLAENPLVQHRRAPGNTCMAALKSGGSSWSALPSHRLNDSKGCGTVMRTAPVGWFSHWSVEEAFEIGIRASAITHNHPTGYIAGGAMSAIVRAVVGGAELIEAARLAAKLAEKWQGHEETVNAIAKALELVNSRDVATPETIEKLGLGWVAEEALAIGLYAAIKGDSLEECLEIAINHSGDSDSTGSIAGQLRGAKDGLRGIPYNLIRRIDAFMPMLELIDQGAKIAKEMNAFGIDDKTACLELKVKNSYRNVAFDAYPEEQCAYCGFGIKAVLEVAHLDQNRANNAKENLAVLCPNCHKMHDIGLIPTSVILIMRDHKKIPRWEDRMKDAPQKAGAKRKENTAKRRKSLAGKKAWDTRTKKANENTL
jgi:ADP-ribosylglycohydrolase/protein-tyrosine phosphatase